MNEMRKLMEAVVYLFEDEIDNDEAEELDEMATPRKNTALKIFRQLLGPGKSYGHPHGGTIKMHTDLKMTEIVSRVKAWVRNNPDAIESFNVVKDDNKRTLDLKLVEGFGRPSEWRAGRKTETHWNFRRLVVVYYPMHPDQIFASVKII
jgi:hypothetical protein